LTKGFLVSGRAQGKGTTVAKQKRNALDNVASRLRELLDDLDRLFNPPQPKRARVPVPVRVPQNPRHSPYR
jgi:hypothetical protein